jgi:hypothetical protein
VRPVGVMVSALDTIVDEGEVLIGRPTRNKYTIVYDKDGQCQAMCGEAKRAAPSRGSVDRAQARRLSQTMSRTSRFQKFMCHKKIPTNTKKILLYKGNTDE